MSQEPTSADRFLLVSLENKPYALAVSGVSGLAPSGRLRPLCRAPDAVVGLTEWRGNVLTVIDLARLLDAPAPGGADCLLRLAPPWHRTALRIPATVRLVPPEVTSRIDAEERRIVIDGQLVPVLDVQALVRRVETEIKERG